MGRNSLKQANEHQSVPSAFPLERVSVGAAGGNRKYLHLHVLGLRSNTQSKLVGKIVWKESN